MAEIESRLKILRDGLKALREQLAKAEHSAAVDQTDALAAELDEIIRDAQAARQSAVRPRRARVKTTDAERCPICSIRSLHPVPDMVEEEDMLWRCLSCGYEVWRLEDRD
jgi:DNA-directed RNA polymerase subunit RPC12/RpoP